MRTLLTITLVLASRLAFAAAEEPQDIIFKANTDGSEQRYVELPDAAGGRK